MNPSSGVSTCIAPDLPRAEFLGKVAASGLRELELLAEPGILGDWLADPVRARREIEAAGLRVRSVHTPEKGWDNGSPDAEKRRASERIAASCLGPAAEIGAGVVIWHPTYGGCAYAPEEAAGHVARAGDSLAAFAERALTAGLRVAVENLPLRKTARPLASVTELMEFITPHGEHVGVCLDAGHANANGLSAAEEARAAGARLLATHIQDNDGLGEDQHLVPGRGTTDWPAFIRALEEIRYAGGLIFEVAHTQGEAVEVLTALAGLVRGWTGRTVGLA